jgi:hypothetical protein
MSLFMGSASFNRFAARASSRKTAIRLTVTGVTTANNRMSSILLGGNFNPNISDNIRNGSRTFACSRLRANGLSGSGYSP